MSSMELHIARKGNFLSKISLTFIQTNHFERNQDQMYKYWFLILDKHLFLMFFLRICLRSAAMSSNLR